MLPTGPTDDCAATACRISSTEMPRVASASRSYLMRTARFCAPWMLICATPVRVERRGLITLSANSFISCDGAVSEVSARKMIGRVGRIDLAIGRRRRQVLRQPRRATEMADCTSSAAASMLRLRSNSSVICVMPSVFSEVMAVMPAMVANCRSSGAATETAMVSGLAPGYCARHGDGRHLDARDGGDRQLAVAEEAGQQQRRHQQRRHHRAADAELGKTHARLPRL